MSEDLKGYQYVPLSTLRREWLASRTNRARNKLRWFRHRSVYWATIPDRSPFTEGTQAWLFKLELLTMKRKAP